MLFPKRGGPRTRIRSSLPDNRHRTPVTVQPWRKSTNYRAWRTFVVTRDLKTCQFCGGKKHLTAHHIIPASVAPDLRYAHLNGITLCRLCHRALDRAMGEYLLTSCAASCAFMQLMRIMEEVRSTGDRRHITWSHDS